MTNYDEIIQIIPAPANLYFKQENEKEIYYIPIVCIALSADGDIAFCDSDDGGYIDIRLNGNVMKYDPSTGTYNPFTTIVDNEEGGAK